MIRHDSKKRVSVSLPMELYEQIKTLSEETERTTSAYIRACAGVGERSYDHQMSGEKVMPNGHKQAGVHIASAGGRVG